MAGEIAARRDTGLPPFVGRVSELALLRSLLDAAAGGRGSLVLLSGEPGIGKSRLADEAVELARARGFATGWGRSWESGGAPPFWPWRRALRSAFGNDLDDLVEDLVPAVRGRLGAVLPDLGGPDRVGNTQEDRFALFDAVSTLLRRTADDRPVLLVLDDLHASDESSLLLLRFVADELRDARFLAIGTYRSTEARSDESIDRLITDLAREHQHVPLGGLDPDGIRQLAEVHGDRSEPSHVSELVEATGGNPFFAVEMLRLRAAGEGWSLPDTVRGTLLQRLERLPGEVRRVLEVAAVVGRRLEPTLIARVAARPAQEVVATLDRCVIDGVLVEVEGRYRFAHGLFRETIYDRLPPSERARLHAAVLGELESLRGAEVGRHLDELAHHALVAGEELAGRAIDYAEGAGRRASDHLAFEEAARHYRRAVDAADRANVGWERLVELLLGQGGALNAAGQVEAAREVHLRVVDLARHHGEPEALARAALGVAGLHWDTFATNERAVALLREALDALPARDHPLRVRCLARLGYELGWGTGYEGREPADQALAMADRLGDPELVALCLSSCRLARGYDRPLAVLVEEVDRTIDAATSAGELHVELFAMVVRVALDVRAGDRVAAERDIAAHARRAEMYRLPYHRWWARVHAALLSQTDGLLDEAERLASDAAAFGARINPNMAMSVFGAQYWAILLERDQAESAFEMFRALPEEALRPPVMQLGMRTMEVWRGNVGAARRVVDEWFRDGFAGIPVDPTRPGVLHHLATLAVATDHREAAAALVDLLRPLESEVVSASGFAVFGTYAFHLARLSTLLERWDDAERDLDLADRVAARLEAPVLAGWARHARARYLMARSETGGARSLLQEIAHRASVAGHLRLAADAAADLASLGDPGAAARPADRVPTLVQEGELWTLVGPAGTTRLRGSKGLGYLATLLANPDVEVHVMEIVSEVGPTVSVARPDDDGLVAARPGDLGPVLDARAKAAFRRRVDELREEIDEAGRFHDPERRARASEELDALMEHLSAATGLGGRDRRMGSRVEQTRVNVTKAIRGAVRRIAQLDPDVGAHLSATVRTGTFCAYHPGLDAGRGWTVGTQRTEMAATTDPVPDAPR